MAQPTVRSSSQNSDTSFGVSSIVVTKPAGTASGDKLVAFMVSAANPVTTNSPPSGFSAARASTTLSIVGGSFTTRISVFDKTAGGSEPASYTFTTGANAAVVVILAAVQPGSGDSSVDFDVIGTFTTGTGTGVTIPAVTTSVANELLLGMAYGDGSGAGTTWTSAALTEIQDAAGAWMGSGTQASAGSTGTKAVTAGTSGAYAGILAAYKGVSSDVTAALSGQALASARGTVTPATSKELTGQALTGAQGSVAPSISIALTGQSLTASQGSLAPSASVPLDGSQATLDTGTLTAVTDNPDVSVALTGQSLSLSQGSVSPALDTALSGQEVVSAAGTLAPEASVGLSGQSLTGDTGTLSVTGGDVTVALTGMALTIAQGTIVAQGADAPVLARTAMGGGGSLPKRRKRRRELVDEVDAFIESKDISQAEEVARSLVHRIASEAQVKRIVSMASIHSVQDRQAADALRREVERFFRQEEEALIYLLNNV